VPEGRAARRAALAALVAGGGGDGRLPGTAARLPAHRDRDQADQPRPDPLPGQRASDGASRRSPSTSSAPCWPTPRAASGARLVTPGDPLFTPIGRFLRKYKLDEIPQLLNVIKGDMKHGRPAAGPAHLPRHLGARHPALPWSASASTRAWTGLAQLRGRLLHPSAATKLRYDRIYQRRRGFLARLQARAFADLREAAQTAGSRLGLLLALIFLAALVRPGRVSTGRFEIKVGGFKPLAPSTRSGSSWPASSSYARSPRTRLLPLPHPDQPADGVLRRLLGGWRGWWPAICPRACREPGFAYFSASGFLIFLPHRERGDYRGGSPCARRGVVAFAAVAVALLGPRRDRGADARGPPPSGPGGDGTLRITATLGSPVVLARLPRARHAARAGRACPAPKRREGARTSGWCARRWSSWACCSRRTRTGLLAPLGSRVRCSRGGSRAACSGSSAGATLGLRRDDGLRGARLRLSPAALSAEWTRRVDVHQRGHQRRHEHPARRAARSGARARAPSAGSRVDREPRGPGASPPGAQREHASHPRAAPRGSSAGRS